MKRVIGIGNALVDVLIRMNDEMLLETLNLPKGSMQLVDSNQSQKYLQLCSGYNLQTASGGSAANTIHGLARLGMSSGYIGKIGIDDYGQLFADDLQNNGIMPVLSFGKDKTGVALTLISPDSQRTFATFLGAAIELSANDLSELQFKNYDWLHIEGYLVLNHDLVEKAIELAVKLGLKISIDLASFNVVESNKDFLQKIVSQADIVFANEDEALAYTGEEPSLAAMKMAKQCNIAVVKTGATGSIVRSGDKQYYIPVVTANCIDTTGAGDLYAAGFLYGICNDLPLEKCGYIGSIVAAAVVESIGAKISDEKWITIKKQLYAL